jgi:hypothetical protein
MLRTLIPDADPRIFQLFDGWRSARNGQAVARRSDFDPLLVAPLLGFL